MDKRSILAVILILLVIIGGQFLMPRTPEPTPADSTKASAPNTPSGTIAGTPAGTISGMSSNAPVGTPSTTLSRTTPAPALKAETLTVSQQDRVAKFSTVGAAPLSITLPAYPDLKHHKGALSIVSNHGPLLRYRVIAGRDTLALDNLSFTATTTANAVDFSSPQGVRVHYELTPDHYISRATISTSLPQATKLFIDLPQDLRSGEADTVEDLRHLAYSYRPVKGDVQSLLLQKLDTTK